MAILNLFGYRAEAEILGDLREVEFNREVGFTIKGLTLAEANRLIEILSTGKLHAIQPNHGQAPGAQPQQADPVAPVASLKVAPVAVAPKPPPAAEPAPEPDLVPEPAVESAPAGPAAEAATVEPPKRGRGRPPKQKPEPELVASPNGNGAAKPTNGAAKPAPVVTPPTAAKTMEVAITEEAIAATGLDSELVLKLCEMRKMRDLLGELYEAGYHTQSAMYEVCSKLRTIVPLLSRCPDLPDRVKSIGESIGAEP